MDLNSNNIEKPYQNMKNFTYTNPLRLLPEEFLIEQITSLSQEIEMNNIATQWLKEAQRDYYLQELIQRDENLIP